MNKKLINEANKFMIEDEDELPTEDVDNNDIDDKIKQFFIDNPYPKDDKVHEFATELGLDPDELETKIYALLSSLLEKEQDEENDI